MFNLSYKYCNHAAYLQNLADALHVEINNNTIEFPPEIALGYIKMVPLTNGLQVLINECVINTDIHIFCARANTQSYTLRFDQVSNMKNLTLEIGKDLLQEKNQFYSGAFLTNSLFDFGFATNAGTENRSVNIYFTEEWLNKYSGIKSTDDFITKYLSLKTAAFTFEVLNIEYRELMEEIFNLKEGHPIYKAVLQNRVLLLLEKFFRNLYTKMSATCGQAKTEEDEIKRMMQVECILVSNFSTAPPPLSDLSRVALMGETKLKALFKKIYGLSPYEYYQKNRMLKARQLLNKRKHSVKEVGRQLGFQNLSNFTIAYKKAFNMLPSSV